MAAIVCDDRDGFPIVARQYADNGLGSVRRKCNPVSDTELQHPCMRAHMLQKPKPFDNPMIKVDEFGFR